jgi:hypothetical protein
MFHLLDEQQVAFEIVRKAINQSLAGNGKTVVIVSGGPGTGKSVIAIRIVGFAPLRGLNVSHATGSSPSPRLAQDRWSSSGEHLSILQQLRVGRTRRARCAGL